MKQRVRHYYHGIGTIREERGAETLVSFDNGESLRVYTMTLTPIRDEKTETAISQPPDQDTHPHAIPPEEAKTDTLLFTRDTAYKEETSPATEKKTSGKKGRTIPPQVPETNRNDTYLTMIVLIIGIIFISAVIITTTPEPPEEIPITNSNSAINQSQPAVWGMLEDYFGRSVIVINATPNLPPEAPDDTADPVIEYDDELFIQTITAGAVPLTIISMHTIIAIDQSNAQILAQNIESLQTIAGENFGKVSKMRVSRGQIERKEDFQHAMLEFISASSYLRRGLPASDSERREALNYLATGTERLDAALRDINLDIESLTERDLYAVELSTLSAPTKPDDLLALGTPFIYKDATESNEISIYPRYARRQTTIWYDDAAGTGHLTAGEGKTFMIILIQVTHRGNLDGRRYTIQTPQPAAFTLHGGGETFTPVQTVAHTSLGEMYRPFTLNRKESRQSSILFEVPYSLSPLDAHLSINLGSTWGTPAWDLKE
ncbi:hypothetical protein RJ53_04685 [Methanocalculus chunghsingensis]|uniref:Uncharacterized protein n=1 Tax=Methanocalculus chunghsingensis TaxID=156457 RepID=A0A8J8B5A0_9EURY|nr:hypothetical protein [Methanocalculus chunghsingensis]MBR1368844.1 hypothetical protein [Methanocalculus chunghsingensis]